MTMSFINQRALILGIVMVGMTGPFASAQGATRPCKSAECACERALEKNTVEALEEFLKDYQHDASVKETACGALAVPPEDDGGKNQNAKYQISPDQFDGVSTD